MCVSSRADVETGPVLCPSAVAPQFPLRLMKVLCCLFNMDLARSDELLTEHSKLYNDSCAVESHLMRGH